MAALGAAICNVVKRVGRSVTLVSTSLVGLDDRRQATRRDSGGYPKTVTYIAETNLGNRSSKCNTVLYLVWRNVYRC